MAVQISQGDLIKKSWEMVKSDWMFFIVGFLVTFLVGYISLGILMGPLMVGFVMAINKKAKGETVGIGDIFNLGFSKFLPAFLAMLIVGVAYFVGIILLVIPGILVMIFCAWTIFILADSDLDAVGAIKASVALTKANFGTTFITLIVAGFIGGIGTVACYVGALVTAPMAVCMLNMAYQQLKGGTQAAA